MRWPNKILLRLRSLFHRDAVDREMEQELRFHLEHQIAANLAAGMPPDEARYTALREFGAIAKFKEECRDMRNTNWLHDFFQDLRYGARTLRRSPGFTIVAVLTLALGIGANTACFSILEGVLLEPLPYKNSQDLLSVRDVQPKDDHTPSSFPEYEDWRSHTEVFSQLAAFFRSNYVLTGNGEPEQITGLRVSANYLSTLGIQPFLGRDFSADETSRSGPHVAILSYGMWRDRFGGDANALGKSILLDDQSYTIVGVLPPSFSVPLKPAFLTGLRLNEQIAPRGFHFLNLFGRLRQGLTIVQARKQLPAIVKNIQDERHTEHGLYISPMKDELTAGVGTPLYILLGSAGFVLLIGCANVANLLLARAVGRRKEIAIRTTLGATPARLIRQLLAESLLLAAGGGAFGLLLAQWGVQAVVTAAQGKIPRINEVHTNLAVLAFTACVSLLVAALFGIAPAWAALNLKSSNSLKEGESRGSVNPMNSWPRKILITAEIALSLALLAGAGLMLRSLDRLFRVSKGFDSDRVLTFDINLSATRYAKPEQQVQFFQSVLDRLRSLPGVESVGLDNSLPFDGSVDGGYAIEGRTFAPDSQPSADKRIVSPGYFQTLRIPLLEGRDFTDADIAQAPHVTIINKAFAEKYFPRENPIGHRIGFLWGINGLQTIVGIVGNVRHDSLAVEGPPAAYVPVAQRPDSGFSVAIRSKLDPKSLVTAARQQVLAIDPSQPITHVGTLDELVALSAASQRLPSLLLGAFAGLALILAAIGIYGVFSYSVMQRTAEIGIRAALGAHPRDILRLVIGHGVKLTLAGVAVGVVAALALTRLLSSLLYGVSTRDPLTFILASLLLAVVAVLACYIPARRAMRVDPLVALRHE
jgi:putative ABC transport system permease protein